MTEGIAKAGLLWFLGVPGILVLLLWMFGFLR